MTKSANFPCPACGYMSFSEGPGSYEICPICFWEDDITQLRFVRTTGANRVNLIEAQTNFKSIGVCEPRSKRFVHEPSDVDLRDPTWRPIDESIDNVEEQISGTDYGATYPTMTQPCTTGLTDTGGKKLNDRCFVNVRVLSIEWRKMPAKWRYSNTKYL